MRSYSENFGAENYMKLFMVKDFNSSSLEMMLNIYYLSDL